MVDENKIRQFEVKQVFFFVILFQIYDTSKRLKQIKLPISLDMNAVNSELPSTISTTV